jgi:peroxiredoxin
MLQPASASLKAASRRALAAIAACMIAALGLWGQPVGAGVAAGDQAPDFVLEAVDGKTHTLSAQRGRYVVLEWTNPGCPFVAKHYDSRNMPALQQRYRDQGVVWWSISSTNPSSTDWLPVDELTDRMRAWDAVPSALLLDEDGQVGRAWGAKTTPQMFVIDPDGKVVYAGAIDDRRSTNPAHVADSRNWVEATFDDIAAGRPIAMPGTTPYGCSVKY